MRAYSPVSSNDDLGYFELVIKVCRPCLDTLGFYTFAAG